MSQHDNTMYIRGVFLGLTMAEIVILIIFCLLLLFNVIVEKKNSEIKKFAEEVKKKTEQIKIISEQPSLKEALGQIYNVLNKNSFEDAFKELILIKEQVSDLKKNNERLNKKINELKKADELINTIGMSPEEISDTIKLTKDLENELNKLSKNDKTVKDIPNIINSLQQDVQDYKNREKYLQRKCKGTEKPACWADSSGKPEYIFQVALTSEGVVLHDNKLPHHAMQQKNLPIDKIPFHEVLNAEQFRNCTSALFQWSQEKDCRFFVKVFDMTKPDEKKIYKKRLRLIEEHFYKYEAINENPNWLQKQISTKQISGTTSPDS